MRAASSQTSSSHGARLKRADDGQLLPYCVFVPYCVYYFMHAIFVPYCVLVPYCVYYGRERRGAAEHQGREGSHEAQL